MWAAFTENVVNCAGIIDFQLARSFNQISKLSAPCSHVPIICAVFLFCLILSYIYSYLFCKSAFKTFFLNTCFFLFLVHSVARGVSFMVIATVY